MKKNIYLLGALIMSTSCIITARINFGSENSGFVVASGALAFDSSTPTVLDGGLIRDRAGNAITAVNGLACSNMTFDLLGELQVEPYEMKVDGVVIPGGSITLSNDQKLTVRDGLIVGAVTVAGASDHPSIIEGCGEFDSTLTINNNAALNIRWTGPLNKNISMTALEAQDGSTPADTCCVQLNQDLEFAPGCFFVPTRTSSGDCFVNCKHNDTQYTLSMGGTASEYLAIDHDFTITNPDVRLHGPLVINNTKTLNIGGGRLEGSGNTVKFEAIYSFINNKGVQTTLSNVVFSHTTPNSFQGAAAWEFVNCHIMSNAYSWYVNQSLSLDLQAESFDMTARLVNQYTDLFVGDASFAATTQGELELSLHTDISVYGRWQFNDVGTIKGNNKTITFCSVQQEVSPGVEETVKQGILAIGSTGMRFENVTLAQMKDVVIDTSLSGNSLYLCNVQWHHNDGNSIFVTGLYEDAAELHLVVDSNEVAGDIFSTNVTWANAARIELCGDTTVTSSWTFNDDCVIDGKGAVLDVNGGVFKIAPEATLILRNVVLKNVSAGLFQHTIDCTGAARLSNVIMELTEDITWNKDIRLEGPVTVITGSHTLHGFTVEVGTVLYDTLGADDDGNVTVWSGQALHIGTVSGGSGGGSNYNPHTTGTITVDGNASLDKNEYLFPNFENLEGRLIHCTNSGLLYGNGRTLVCPQTHGLGAGSGVVLTVDSGAILETTQMVIDGLVPSEHLDVSGDLYFGNGTIVRLHQDTVLSEPLRFGSNSDEVTGAYMELDLGGNTLDLGLSNGIHVYGQIDAENSLVIKNGRIILNGSAQLGVSSAHNELVLENIEIVLNATDWVYDSGWLTIGGNCRISGSAGSALIMSSPDEFEIRDVSTLTLCDGIVYSHSSSTDFVLASALATLELIGGTFRHPDYSAPDTLNGVLTLSTGRLVVDHKSYMQPGSVGMVLDSNLIIELRPGATIVVGTYVDDSLQDTTAGTLTYGN